VRRAIASAAAAAWLICGGSAPAAAQPPPPVIAQPVTLAQAIEIAAARSPILAEARADYRLTEADVDLARTGRAPAVTVDGIVAGTLPAWSGGTTYNNTLGITFSQLVADGGHVLAQIAAAQYGRLAGAGTYKRAAQSLSFTVAVAYYNALQTRANVALSKEIVQQYRRGEGLIQAQIAAGIASRLDLATAHAPTVRAALQVAQAQAAADFAQAAFVNALGLTADAPVVPIDDASASALGGQPLSYQAAYQRALLLRPDYQASLQSIAQAEATIRANRTLVAPMLVASGGAAVLPSTPAFLPSHGLSELNTLQLQLQLPVYDRGVSRALVTQAEAGRDRARAVAQQMQNDVSLQVSQALAALAGARAARDDAEAELRQGKQLLADTEELYRAGRAQILQLINAQTTLAQAESDRLSAIYALRQAEQTYLFALGEG
jgi:outer membrane protein